VVHHDEEADGLECVTELGRRGGQGARLSGEIRSQIDHRDHDDEIALCAAFDNEPGGV
jgi:hypothetical protein